MRTRRLPLSTTRLLRFAIAAAVLMTGAWGCDGDAAHDARMLTNGGNAYLGQVAIKQYGCGSCHTIPGVDGATATVGPPLAGIATRTYIGGVLLNQPENLMRWIQDAPGVDPKTAMPNVGVTPGDARNIAAYLYTLR